MIGAALLTWAKALNLPGTEIAANLAWKESVKVSGEHLVLEMNRNDKVFKAVSRDKSKDRQARQETAQDSVGGSSQYRFCQIFC